MRPGTTSWPEFRVLKLHEHCFCLKIITRRVSEGSFRRVSEGSFRRVSEGSFRREFSLANRAGLRHVCNFKGFGSGVLIAGGANESARIDLPPHSS